MMKRTVDLMMTVSSAALIAGAGGCTVTEPAQSEPLRAQDFAATTPSPPETPREPPPVTWTPARDYQMVAESSLTTGLVDVTATPGPPAAAEGPVLPAGGLVLVDAKVGDINGRPVFASAFLEEFDAQFRAEAENLSLDAWRLMVASAIRQKLEGMIHDELIRNEVLASFSAEERVGLTAFLANLGENARRRNAGSIERAKQSIRQQEQKSWEQWRRDREYEALIGYWLDNEIRPQVHVSQTEIREYYDAHYDEFNPPPVARFRRIRVPSRDRDKVDQVVQLLADGAPFEEVAASKLNEYRSDAEGLIVEQPIVGEFAEQEFFGQLTELNEAARRMKPGDVAGPIDTGARVYWLKLEQIHRAEGQPLAVVQKDIEQILLLRRRDEATRRYMARLLADGSFTDLALMIRRLSAIAEARYWPQDKG